MTAAGRIDCELPRDIQLMAKAICGDDANPLLLEQALAIAECEMVLRYVRAQWVALVERLRDVTVMPLAIGDSSWSRPKPDRGNGPAWDGTRSLQSQIRRNAR